MHVRLLGTAAGGGFPQWNCACRNCRIVRSGSARATARTQTSVAVSGDGSRWFLVGASPDLGSQIESMPALDREQDVRRSPIRGILLACADLDHVLGLLVLREGRRLRVHASPSVRRSVSEGLSLDSVLGAYCGVDWQVPTTCLSPLVGDDGLTSGLLYEAFRVPGGPPRYRAGRAPAESGDCVGYRFVDERTGGRLAVVPGLASLGDEALAKLAESDALLIDGTFWSEHELSESGIEGPPASAMGHLVVGGPGGSLSRIAGLPAATKLYIHINNTNPMLLNDSPERREVEAAGVGLGRDGMDLTL